MRKKMCYGSESVKLGYDSSITPGQAKKHKTKENKDDAKEKKKKKVRDRYLQARNPECVTYQKGIMATVVMDMVTNDNYCYSQRNQYQPPIKKNKRKRTHDEGLHATEPP